MINRNKIISMLALTLVLVWFIPITVQAETPSVNDCLENKSNCSPSGEKQKTENTDAKNESEVQPSEELNSDDSSSSMFFTFLKLIFALALVLGLIYLLLKLTNRKNKMFQKHHTLENLGGVTLGAQKSMQIVRIGERYYVVGVGDNVELLTELKDEKIINELMNENGNSDFNPANLVTSLIGKKQEKRTNDDNKQNKEEFSAMFKRELNMLKSGRKHTIDRYMKKGDKENE